MQYTFEQVLGQQATYLVWFEDGRTLTVGIDPAREDVTQAVDEVVQYSLALPPSCIPAPTYRELRAEAYPSIQDQLDIIFHQGLEGWRDAIQQIKDEYPKEG